RLGTDSSLHVWLGDGHGKFTKQTLSYVVEGRPRPSFAIGYGGVAVGDIDGDGKLDIVTASHSLGLTAFFGEGGGKYTVSRKGLPGREFSAQAVALIDVNGDGKLDIVASQDSYELTAGNWDPHQVRVFLNDGARGFRYAPDALIDAAYSNCLTAWDYDRDGKMDLLTGSQAYGAVQMLWHNTGAGKFTTGYFPQIEIHGFHFTMAPGTFGRERLPAFADAFVKSTNAPTRLEAQGITVYSYDKGEWTRHRVQRKKDGKSFLYAMAMGDIDGDGLDDIVFADSTGPYVLRIFLQQPDGTFKEADEKQEPKLDSPGQCIRLADLDGDGRLDIVVSKTYSSARPNDPGGWTVFMNRK
ncbi:MAG TPA: VCBS repeat-containing protein, partial [Thermoanaerobaculia bacterium]|nr:VCBS repeat-containing protein [Thermoanaerobaculia bacterium]